MIEFARGNLLKAEVDALVNTVNTEGVMGKGIALQFKRAYPKMYADYRSAAELGLVKLGKMHVVDLGAFGGGPKYVINFPTKGHWKSRSQISDIIAGLQDLRQVIQDRGIRSIALPPLGCGNGGLDWEEVRPIIVDMLGSLEGVRVLLFAPDGAPGSAEMPNRTSKPPMTMGMASTIALISQYKMGLMEPFVRLIEVHKLMYFLQEAGEKLKLHYSKGTYGPYSVNLRHVLNRMETHYAVGFGDGQDRPTQEIDLVRGAVDEAREYLDGHADTRQRMIRVADLIDGFEDPYGMELLGSVHWVMMHEPECARSVDATAACVRDWSSRKSALMRDDHIARAWTRLKEQRWDVESSSARH